MIKQGVITLVNYSRAQKSQADAKEKEIENQIKSYNTSVLKRLGSLEQHLQLYKSALTSEDQNSYREILMEDVANYGLAPPNRNDLQPMEWLPHLKKIKPYIARYGIEEAKKKLNL